MLVAIPFLLFAAGKVIKAVVMVAGVVKIVEVVYRYYVLVGSATMPESSYYGGYATYPSYSQL